MKISDYLHEGAEHAQTATELCKLLNLDKRALTMAIERERQQGSPICANCANGAPGYYLAANKEEMQTYCKKLHHRAAAIFGTRRACLNTLEKLPEGSTYNGK